MRASGTNISATGHKAGLGNVLYDKAGARPDLDLDFARTKSLKDKVSKENLITFTRSSGTGYGATYVDENGLVKVAPVNFVKYSQDFNNTYWQKSNSNVTPNFATAPDGTQTATKIEISQTGSSYLSFQAGFNGVLTVGKTYTFSIYVKKTDVDSQFNMQANPTTGLSSVTGSTQLGITPTPTEWTRYSITFIPNSSIMNIFFNNAPDTYSTNALIWGAQINEGTEPTQYIPTTDQASGAPRFTHNPETLESKGLLIEQAATNLVPYSEDFTQSAWNKEDATATANQTTAPDGTNTATLVTATGDANRHRIREPGFLLGPNQYTFSCFVKANTTNHVLFKIYKGNDGTNENSGTLLYKRTLINSNGTVTILGADGTLIAEKYPNGWYRLIGTTKVDPQSQTATTSLHIGILRENSPSEGYVANNESIYVWGAQLEATPLGTSYIPTSGGTATRSADVVTIEGDNFGTYRANMLNAVTPNLVIDNTGVTTNGGSVIENTSNMSVRPYSALAPDGTFSAVEMEDDDLGSTSAVRQISYHIGNVIATDKGNGPLLTNTTYTVSGYFKAGTASKAAFWLAGNDWITSYPQIWINLSDGSLLGSTTIHTNNNATVTPAGNGWYRLSLTATTNSSPPLNNIKLRVNSVNPSGTSTQLEFTGKAGSFYMWGLQIEEGTSVTTYIPSTDAFTNRQSSATYVDSNGIIRSASAGTARYSHDPETLTPTGLYLEPEIKNKATTTETFTHSNYLYTDASDHTNTGNTLVNLATDNSITNPDGTTGTVFMTAVQGDLARVRVKGIRKAGAAYQTQTLSCFVKKKTNRYVALSHGGVAQYRGLVFDFNTETFTDHLTGAGFLSYKTGFVKYPNGWYRLFLHTTGATGGDGFAVHIPKDPATSKPQTGGTLAYDGTESVYIWGLNCCDVEFLSTYIPNSSNSEITQNPDTFTSEATEVLDRAKGTKPTFFPVFPSTAEGISLRCKFRSNNQRVLASYTTTNNAGQTVTNYPNTHQDNIILEFENSGSEAFRIEQEHYANWGANPGTQPRIAVVGPSLYGGQVFSEDQNVSAVLRYQTNNALFRLSKTNSTTDTNFTTKRATKLNIGKAIATGNELNGIMSRLTIWKTPLSNSTLPKLVY